MADSAKKEQVQQEQAQGGEDEEVEEDMAPFMTVYRNGSVKRASPPLLWPADEEPQPEFFGVRTKDVQVEEGKGLWLRIFKPPHHQAQAQALPQPLVIFFHGGGFVSGSPAWPNYHALCADLAARTRSVWISASYRLAPEHRLPAAYEDCHSALLWLQAQARAPSEPWLASGVDIGACFLAGESAGGNMAHHVALRVAASGPSSLLPVALKGMLLIHPGFVRQNRTRAEEESPQDELMNWRLGDACLRVALPPGADRDHPFLNPLQGELRALRFLPRILVALADRDGLLHMGLEYARALQLAGCHVDTVISEGVGHVFYVRDPQCPQAHALMDNLASFVVDNNQPSATSPLK